MPQRPAAIDPAERIRAEPRYPYEVVAALLAHQIADETLPPRSFLPSAADLATHHDVSLSTVKRSLALMRDWGLLERDEHNRLRIAARADVQPTGVPPPVISADAQASDAGGDVLLDLTIRHRGAWSRGSPPSLIRAARPSCRAGARRRRGSARR